LPPEIARFPRRGRDLPAIQAILYTLFSEGYLSSRARRAIRRELCDEARRLTGILAEHPVGATPETFALVAAVLADLHRRCGQDEQAEHCRHEALALAPSAAVRAALARRLDPAGHSRP